MKKPIYIFCKPASPPYFIGIGTTGFEPATSASRTQRSTRLSHVPI